MKKCKPSLSEIGETTDGGSVCSGGRGIVLTVVVTVIVIMMGMMVVMLTVITMKGKERMVVLMVMIPRYCWQG